MPTMKAQRVPLGELPLSDFARDPNLPLSPVSLPLKRPATPHGQGTPKRVVALDEDELGTGKSPARRLFDAGATPRAAKRRSVTVVDAEGGEGTEMIGKGKEREGDRKGKGKEREGGEGACTVKRTSGKGKGKAVDEDGVQRGGLAPSPPLTSRSGSTSSLAPSSSASTSLASSAASTPSSRIHDPGFVVFSDDDPAARPPVPSAYTPIDDADEENIAPALEIATPRRKRFEPSKLSSIVTSASSSSPIRSGKEGMIAEADLADGA